MITGKQIIWGKEKQMSQCNGKNKDGSRCRNRAIKGSNFCRLHKKQENFLLPAFAIGGALLGNLLVPGIGAAIIGGIIGGFLGASSRRGNDNDK